MTDAQKRATLLKKAIEMAAVAFKMNLTVFDGKILFVDQVERKIVAMWEPKYPLTSKEGNKDGE